jgi:hypothetical protein
MSKQNGLTIGFFIDIMDKLFSIYYIVYIFLAASEGGIANAQNHLSEQSQESVWLDHSLGDKTRR